MIAEMDSNALGITKWFADDNDENMRMLPFTAALDLPDQIRIVAQFRMGFPLAE